MRAILGDIAEELKSQDCAIKRRSPRGPRQAWGPQCPRVHTHARRHTQARTSTHTLTHAHAHKRTRAHTCRRAHTHTHTHKDTHTHTHTRTLLHAHTHIHTGISRRCTAMVYRSPSRPRPGLQFGSCPRPILGLGGGVDDSISSSYRAGAFRRRRAPARAGCPGPRSRRSPSLGSAGAIASGMKWTLATDADQYRRGFGPRRLAAPLRRRSLKPPRVTFEIHNAHLMLLNVRKCPLIN
jgi:hypothetical protein